MTHSSETPPCVICRGTTTSVVKGQPIDYEYSVKPQREFRVFHCGGCGSRFLWPRPTVDELVSFYPLDYHAYNEDHGAIAQPLVAFRSRLRARTYQQQVRRRPIRLFDVGAGDCRHFDALAEYEDFHFAGVEIKPEMVAAARRRGYVVTQGTLEEMDISGLEGTFDIVTMYQLVEHVLDPACLLEKAKALLRPNGLLLGQLPCMDSIERRLFGRYWAGYHYPRHLQMFTRRGIRMLLEQEKLTSITVRSTLHLQAGISLQNYLVDRLQPRPKMKHGKTPFYSVLLLSVMPFALLEYVCGKTGMIDFMARKPTI